MSVRPINLAIIAEHYYPELTGASERFRRYLTGFRARGVETTIFTVWHEGLPEHEMVDDFSVYRVKLSESDLHPSAQLAKQVVRLILARQMRIDVIHILSHTIQGVLPLISLRLKGFPLVHSVTMSPGSRARPLAERIKYSLHQALRYCVFQRVIVGSEEIGAEIRKFVVSPEKVKVIPNGVDTDRFAPLPSAQHKEAQRRELGLPPEDLLVLFAGNISKRKGVDLLLDAWLQIYDQCANAKLLMIGSANEADPDAGKFIQRIVSLSGTRVIQMQPVSHFEKYLQAADVLIFPSRLEGLPNVLLEAMASGLSCVVAPFIGISSLLGPPGITHLRTDFRPEKIAADLAGLLFDEDRRALLGHAARKHVVKHFSYTDALDQHVGIYRQLSSS